MAGIDQNLFFALTTTTTTQCTPFPVPCAQSHTHPTTLIIADHPQSNRNLSTQNMTPFSSSSPKQARTPNGYLFTPADTTDMFAALLTPSKWGPAEALTLFFLVATVLTAPLVSYLPLSFYISHFFFWRVSYNFFLATLLHLQSRNQFFTSLVASASPSARALLNWAVTRTMPGQYRWHKFPAAFNAWLVFRALSMLILSNDGCSYIILTLACFNPISSASLPQLLVCFPVGLALIGFSFWSKASAHHVLGDYAWYWGDFFFTLDQHLTFDGVFELFPHPMYTVGYAAYYGVALICRSYTLLAVSLAAHIMQLSFLALVEEPHIKMIYAPKPSPNKPSPSKPSATAETNVPDYQCFVDAAPSVPVCVVLCLVFGVVSIVSISARPSPLLVITLAILCRAVHWIGTAIMLQTPPQTSFNPTTQNRFVQWANLLHYSNFQTYSSWQHIFLSSYMLNHALFVIATITHGSSFLPHSPFSKAISHILAGTALILIAIISILSSWNTIGCFGFFYGDFFVKPESRELKSSGSFRYVSHPQAILGYLAYYGLAIIKQSSGLFALALVCQAMEFAFVTFVETPNLLTEYKLVERSTPLENAALGLPLVSSLMKMLNMLVSGTWSKVELANKKHGPTLRREMVVRKERLEANLSKSVAKAWDTHKERTQELKNKAESVVGVLSCDKLVTALEKRGIVVERVEQSVVECQG